MLLDLEGNCYVMSTAQQRWGNAVHSSSVAAPRGHITNAAQQPPPRRTCRLRLAGQHCDRAEVARSSTAQQQIAWAQGCRGNPSNYRGLRGFTVLFGGSPADRGGSVHKRAQLGGEEKTGCFQLPSRTCRPVWCSRMASPFIARPSRPTP